MDNKKDIRDRYLSIATIFNGHSAAVQPFKSNFSAAHMYGRAERILAATYILTKNVPENDIARTKIRQRAHDLLSVVSDWFQETGERKAYHIQHLLLVCRELGSLVRVLALGGYLSTANLSLFLQALTDLSAYAQRHVHDESDDGVSSAAIQEQDFVPRTDGSAQGSVSNPTGIKRASSIHHPSVASSVKPVPSVAATARKEDGGTRRQIIIDLLTQKGRLGIRDIALQIVGVSEKTVQRELAQLVIEGKVTKEGKKRWSTYGLII
jgi:hypothetical protein